MDVSFRKKLTTAIYLVFLQSDAFPVEDAGGKEGRGSKSGAGAGEWRARRGLVLVNISDDAHVHMIYEQIYKHCSFLLALLALLARNFSIYREGIHFLIDFFPKKM